MNRNSMIDVLLSTHNGAKYLDEQLRSIAEQDIDEWHLIVRDDASNDDSLSIIEDFALKYPEKVSILSGPQTRLGVIASFECLLDFSEAPYVAFCDQDDVWSPDKLRLMRECIDGMEDRYGKAVPILVHSDLEVVGADLKRLSESFWHYQKLCPSKMQTLEKLLVQNCVTGCATIVNRSLVNQALPIPKDAIMHDWWFALVAASEGQIKELSAKTIKYRQHGMNDTGAKKWDLRFIARSIIPGGEQRDQLLKTRDQALALLDSGKLCLGGNDIVRRYVSLFEQGWFERRLLAIRMGFLKNGLIRNIGLMVWL